MPRQLKESQPSFEVTTHEDPLTGDIILPLPQELLDKMGWKIGDELSFDKDTQGRWVVTKKK